MDKQKIINFINTFVNKKDVSIELANKIEVAIDRKFPDDDYMQSIVEVLASYRPGGGDYLYDEDFVIEKLKNVKKYLNTIWH